MVVLAPVGDAGLGLVDRGMAPAVIAALAVSRLGQIGEGVGELTRPLFEPERRQRIPVAVADQVALVGVSIELGQPDGGIDPEESLDETRVGDVAEPLAPQPVHDLQDLAPPVERSERVRLR